MKTGMDLALDSLSRRAMTAFQLKKRLTNKGFSPSEVNGILTRLSEWGYINDYRFATEFCASRQSRYSRVRIRNDLKQKGIESSIIDQVLSENYPEKRELNQCLELGKQLWEEVRRREERKQLRQKTNAISQSDQINNRDGFAALKDQDNDEYLRDDSLNEMVIEQKVGYKLAQKGYPYEIIREVLNTLKVNR